jgi:hypothetical protein
MSGLFCNWRGGLGKHSDRYEALAFLCGEMSVRRHSGQGGLGNHVVQAIVGKRPRPSKGENEVEGDLKDFVTR